MTTPSSNQEYYDAILAKNLAAAIHAATGKGTPVDADELPIADSASSFGLKKLTWANLKATLKAYFDTLYTPVSTTKVYIATLTQNGGAAPAATELVNTTGATVTWGRTSIGLFTATFSSAVLTADHTKVLMGSLRGSGTGQTNLVTYKRTSTTVVTIMTQFQAAGATNSGLFDGDGSTSGLVETTLEIMIIP